MARPGSVPGIADELRKLLSHSNIDVLTTLFDYYAFPADAPGMSDRPQASALERVRHVEAALASEIGNRRFVPQLRGDPRLAIELHRVSRAAGGPGSLALADLGVDALRAQCPHADEWLRRLGV